MEPDEFWKKLEDEWRNELTHVPSIRYPESDWLSEFEGQSGNTPKNEYEFIEDNPFKEDASCLEAGKKKLAEGKSGP